jgi:hypothetical protein
MSVCRFWTVGSASSNHAARADTSCSAAARRSCTSRSRSSMAVRTASSCWRWRSRSRDAGAALFSLDVRELLADLRQLGGSGLIALDEQLNQLGDAGVRRETPGRWGAVEQWSCRGSPGGERGLRPAEWGESLGSPGAECRDSSRYWLGTWAGAGSRNGYSGYNNHCYRSSLYPLGRQPAPERRRPTNGPTQSRTFVAASGHPPASRAHGSPHKEKDGARRDERFHYPRAAADGAAAG